METRFLSAVTTSQVDSTLKDPVVSVQFLSFNYIDDVRGLPEVQRWPVRHVS